MKHEFQSSILCNESEFPTYPRPSVAATSSRLSTAKRNLNWSFVDGSTLANSANVSTYNPENVPSKQLLTLDLPNENAPQTSRSAASSQSTDTKIFKMNSLNSNANQHNVAPTTSATTSTSGTSSNRSGNNKINNKNNVRINSSTVHGGEIASEGFYLGLYGWRKKCLYVLILGLAILIVVNLALTLWILKVMEFTTDGMGQLKIVPGGLQLTGQALILDLLRASTIRSRHGQSITLESSKNFSINTRDYEGRLDNHLFLGHDKLEVLAHNFKIIDTHGAVLFAVDKNEVAIGANSLRVEGEGGVIFRESIQSPLIRAEPGKELKLESPTRSLLMNAGKDIFIKSGAGNIDASCLNDIRIHSVDGSIRLDSASIFMPNLKILPSPVSSGTSSLSHDHHHQQQQQQQQQHQQQQNKVYQLCACSNGKLFLAMSHSICAGDESTVCS